jgi:hypothetical protein
MSALRGRGALTLACSLLLFAAACGDDEEESSGPSRPPSLRIAEVRGGTGQSWLRPEEAGTIAGPVVASCDPERSLGVRVDVSDFAVRPPKACGGSTQCGTVFLELTGPGAALAAEGSSIWVTVPLGASFQPGEYRLRAELRRNSEPIVVGGDVLSDQVSLTIEAPGGCGSTEAGTDAGVDAEPDAPEPDASPDSAPDAPSEAGDGEGGPIDAGGEERDAAVDSASDAPGDTSSD